MRELNPEASTVAKESSVVVQDNPEVDLGFHGSWEDGRRVLKYMFLLHPF